MPNNNIYDYSRENKQDISWYLQKKWNAVAWKVQMENLSNKTECRPLSLTGRGGGGNAVTDVIVNDLVLLWQLLITPPVTDSPFAIATTALVVCDNHCQEVILWRGPGCPSPRSHQPQIDGGATRPTQSVSPPLLAFSIIIGAKPGPGCWTSTRPSPSLSVRSCDRYIVQPNLLPPRQESVNFCFTLCLFRLEKKARKLQIEDTSNRGADLFDLALNAMNLHGIKF